MWGHWGDYGHGWGLGFGMMPFLGILIVAIVVMGKNVCGAGTCSGHYREKGALGILRERYANGEIDREEFEQKMRDLQGEQRQE